MKSASEQVDYQQLCIDTDLSGTSEPVILPGAVEILPPSR